MNLAEPGRNIVTCSQLYGTTHTLFAHMLPSFGVEVRFADSNHPGDIEALVDENTRAVYCESVGNPAGTLRILPPLQTWRIAITCRWSLITPWQRRFCCGPSIWARISSFIPLRSFWAAMARRLAASSSIAEISPGPGTPIATRCSAKKTIPITGLFTPSILARKPILAGARSTYLRTIGATLPPLSAFLLLQGIESAAVRVDRHVENGLKVATFLANDPRVEWVSYAGLPDDPNYPLVQRQLNGRAPSLLTFGVLGGYEAGVHFYNALKLIRRVVNLGDCKSLACHPASTTHRQMTVEEQRKAGVTQGTIRISVGIEHINDIIADLSQALAASQMEARLLHLPQSKVA